MSMGKKTNGRHFGCSQRLSEISISYNPTNHSLFISVSLSLFHFLFLFLFLFYFADFDKFVPILPYWLYTVVLCMILGTLNRVPFTVVNLLHYILFTKLSSRSRERYGITYPGAHIQPTAAAKFANRHRLTKQPTSLRNVSQNKCTDTKTRTEYSKSNTPLTSKYIRGHCTDTKTRTNKRL